MLHLVVGGVLPLLSGNEFAVIEVQDHVAHYRIANTPK